MDSKQSIIDQVTTLAVLKPLTSEAKEAIPRGQLEGEFVCIKKLPFKIGRESRVKRVKGKLERLERPKMGGKEPNNNLYLVDRGRFLNISREHLQIERDENDFILRDRGSACGTCIGDIVVGGEDVGGEQRLEDGDIIAMGAKETPYTYQFISLTEYEMKKKKA